MIALWCALAGAQDLPASVDAASTETGAAAPAEVVAATPGEAEAATGPDRSGPPPVLPPVPLDLPDWTDHALGQLTVRIVHVPEVRKVSARLYLHRGEQDLDGGPTDVAYAAGWLQDVATEDHDADALSIAEDLLDADVWSDAPRLTRTYVSVEVPHDDLGAGLGLLAEVAFHPDYPASEVKRHIRETTRYLLYDAPSSNQSVAGSLLGFGWYPADTPFGSRPDLDELHAIKRKALVAWHERLMSTAPATLLLVGDVTWEEVEPLLAAFSGVGQAGTEAREPAFTPPAKTRVLAADMPGQAQTALYLRYAAPAEDHADRVPFAVVDWALGGPFLSRLNRNLREEKGFTYGAGSSYRALDGRGTWTVSVEVGAENTGAAITEIEGEVARMVDAGVTSAEVDGAVLEWTTGWNTTMLTASSAFDRYDELLQDGETISADRERLAAAGTVTPAQTKEVAARWLGADQPHLWVVVGDKSVVGPQLDALGWDVEWTTPQKAVLGEF